MNSHQAAVLLLDLALILTISRVFGALAGRLGQPPVVGELFAGILVGPTLMHGAIARVLFPLDGRPFLSTLANLGVALFMFAVGLEIDQTPLKGRLRRALSVSTGAIVGPLSLAIPLGLYLAQHHATANRPSFVLFICAAMSVTAFPVLARILADAGLLRSALGGVALACAAINDVVAWSLLGVVVAVVTGAVQWQLALSLPYLVLMFSVVRPLLARLGRAADDTQRLSDRGFAIVLAGLLLSSGFTEAIGLHFIFGAFLFGIVMPRSTRLHEQVLGSVERLSSTLLLPVYFVVAGLQVNLSGLGGVELGELMLILLVAVVGKFGGAFVGARVQGVPGRDALVLGALMNTRGLTELVILTVGFQLGVLGGRVYSLMAVMALITTAMTGPLLHLLRRASREETAAPDDARAEVRETREPRQLNASRES